MRACKNCNADFKMAVKACPEYACGCTQLSISDFLCEVRENYRQKAVERKMRK